MQDFTNENLDLSRLPKYETVTLSELHKNYWKVILLNIAVFMLFLGLASYLLFFLLKSSNPEPYLFIGGYLLFGILLVMFYAISIKKRGYAIREKDLIYKSGIVSISTSVIPFSRIQHITLNEGIFSRMFNLAALHIYTAGGISGNIVIPGLDIELAKSIKEELTKQVNHQDTPTPHQNSKEHSLEKSQKNNDHQELSKDHDGN
ncbi:PH domain-containing protein [Pedobacter gandavensis]|uniref:PH domain-containing protein n=1 Tax=Pedobacter gandavensis TaxID=2679963 RepID=A0ABR6F230_9SPHI|nr:PH domain-containing protein [Pedobacter gandavensis]MBB2150733.1 PH domain-containing protein [Pedobacter gandavensis]